MGKATKILLYILAVIIVLAAGVGIYYWKKRRTVTVDTSAHLLSATPTVTASAIATRSAVRTAAASAASNCGRICSTLSAEERATMSDWRTYTNSTYNYCFKYPSDWTIDETSAELVTAKGSDSDEEITFQAREGRSSEIGFGEYSLVFTRDFTVNCEASSENTYDGADNLSLMTYKFTKSGNPYLVMFSFKDIGASYAGDVYNLGKMILKTFAFSS